MACCQSSLLHARGGQRRRSYDIACGVDIRCDGLKEGIQTGFIAQELEKVFPEFVNTSSDGYKSVDYARLTPVLVEAIKELAADKADMANKVNHLENEMASIKALLEGYTKPQNTSTETTEKK